MEKKETETGMETGNGNWKQKSEQKDAPITGAMSSSVCLVITLVFYLAIVI